jgi:hypothetical protein
MSSMERPRDLIGGLLVAATGAAFLWFGRDLPVGSSFRMGPGYFPTVLSVAMVMLGLALMVVSARRPRQEDAFGAVPWLGLALIILPVLLFGLCLRALGLLPILLVVVLATAWASRYASLKASLLLAIGIALLCSLLFIKGLGLPLPLFGSFPLVSTILGLDHRPTLPPAP